MVDHYLLMTGGTGFLGQALCRHALSRGHRVAVLTRNVIRAGDLLPKNIGLFSSLNDVADLEKVTCLVNLAGEPLINGRWNKARKEKFMASRVGTTQSLYADFSQRGFAPRLVVNGSAVGYYGPHEDRLLDESGKFHDSFSHQLCAAWENAAKQFTELGSRVCLVRTGIVLDKEKGALARMLPSFRMALGGVIGNGKQWMPWIHVEDFVGLVFHLIRRSDIRGAVNATAPNPVTNKQFTKILGAVLHRPAVFRIPGPMVRLIFGEMAKELLLSGQKVYPRKALETGYEFKFPLLEAALKDLLA